MLLPILLVGRDFSVFPKLHEQDHHFYLSAIRAHKGLTDSLDNPLIIWNPELLR